MSLSKEQAEKRSQEGRPVFGWVKEGDGLYSGPNDFPTDDLNLSPEFEEYADRFKVGWSFFEYLRTVINQRLKRRYDRRHNNHLR